MQIETAFSRSRWLKLNFAWVNFLESSLMSTGCGQSGWSMMGKNGRSKRIKVDGHISKWTNQKILSVSSTSTLFDSFGPSTFSKTTVYFDCPLSEPLINHFRTDSSSKSKVKESSKTVRKTTMKTWFRPNAVRGQRL